MSAQGKDAVITFAGKRYPISDFTFRPSTEGMAAEQVEAMGGIGESVANELDRLTSEECAQFSADLDAFWRDLRRFGRKRPGQWGWRAREKRHARRLAAEDRKVAEWQRRALCRARPHFAPNRRTNRLLRRMFGEEVS